MEWITNYIQLINRIRPIVLTANLDPLDKTYPLDKLSGLCTTGPSLLLTSMRYEQIRLHFHSLF